MISLAEARALIVRKIPPLPAAATPLARADGCVLRQNVRAGEDFPAFDRSAMDGYAIAEAGPAQKFRIVAQIQPGPAPKCRIRPGECVRIFTGAPVPTGASRVLMQENVRLEQNFVVPLEKGNATHIRRRGEDARKGELLLKSGIRLGPGDLALLAGLGVTRPKVSPLVRVAHFATGNELVAPDKKPRPGMIRDSNSSLVAALTARFGGEIVRQERLPDEFSGLLKKARSLNAAFDLLLLSGGASVGDYDYGKRLLTALGFRIHFAAINLRPGKPLVFATRGGQAAFVLPGNPVSHLVTLHVAVRLAFEQFAGAAASWPMVRVPLARAFDQHPTGRETFCPARLQVKPDGGGGLIARAMRWQSSGDLTGLAGVNALLRLEAGADSPRRGDLVSVLMLEVP
ncbi:MAG TPA: gephyrin-like molybdotransferase Glp [Candidatus Acidoferrales bacterium]|nr:gephyrin-like molybdotransferase Glp [Candidatus Acidoferrales bacterium]